MSLSELLLLPFTTVITTTTSTTTVNDNDGDDVLAALKSTHCVANCPQHAHAHSNGAVYK